MKVIFTHESAMIHSFKSLNGVLKDIPVNAFYFANNLYSNVMNDVSQSDSLV